ncbi:MAG: NADH:flavin oxidoreductase, partial [Desulfitobacteriaceae bacterium]
MKILSPIKIGNLEIRNRVVMAPMTNNFAQDGFITERMIHFYAERAKGGVGLVTVEDGIVDFPIGNNAKNAVAIDDDKYIPMLQKLSAVIKKHGAQSAIQLSHGGRRAGRVSLHNGYLEVTRGQLPVAPSVLAHPFPGQVVPRELRVEEIEEIVEKFGQAARRAVEAGFDVISIHCAHMYLCGEFLSPWANKRTDQYGGSLENRMRFVLEIIARVQKEVGAEFPLICRMNGQEPEGGNSLLEIREIAQRLEMAGIKAISVSVGFGAVLQERNFISAEAPIGTPEGCIVH